MKLKEDGVLDAEIKSEAERKERYCFGYKATFRTCCAADITGRGG